MRDAPLTDSNHEALLAAEICRFASDIAFATSPSALCVAGYLKRMVRLMFCPNALPSISSSAVYSNSAFQKSSSIGCSLLTWKFDILFPFYLPEKYNVPRRSAEHNTVISSARAVRW